MFTNQPSWSGSFFLVVTLPSLVPAVGMLCHTLFNEMTKITISNQSHKSYKKYKSENGRIYQRWDQVPWRSKHPLLTDHTLIFYFTKTLIFIRGL
jgi:hypothetical protein